jgi:hypothetical protein
MKILVCFRDGEEMMASQKVAIYRIIVLSRALEILHILLRSWKITIPCIWRLLLSHPVDFLRVHQEMM